MFQIDRFGRQPIYEQIIEQVEQLIASGALRPGDQLPSVRALSQAISANPNTLQKAYAELERRGVTVSAPGSGRFISRDAQKLVSEGLRTLLTDITTLSAKLHMAGIPREQVHQAVDAAFDGHPLVPARLDKPETANNPETAVSPQAETRIPVPTDAPQGATRKDAEQ